MLQTASVALDSRKMLCKIIGKLHGEIVAIMALPDVRERFVAQAAEPVGNRPEEYAAFIQSEIVKWAKVVKEAGLKVD